MSRLLFMIFIVLSLNIKLISCLFFWNHFLAACHCDLATKFPIITYIPTESTTTTTTTTTKKSKKTKKTKKTRKTRKTTKRRCCTTRRCRRTSVDPRVTWYPRVPETEPFSTEIVDYDYYEEESTEEPQSYEDTYYSDEYSVEILSSKCQNTIPPCPAKNFTPSSDITNPNGVLNNGCPCRDIEKILLIMQLIMEDMQN